jgi:hypothetical protein
MVRLVRHRQTKGPATDRPHLNHRATSRLYNSIDIRVPGLRSASRRDLMLRAGMNDADAGCSMARYSRSAPW